MSKKEVKVLHCADLHLGAEFSTLGEKAGNRKRENILALERILSVCKEESVDFLLIAGDLFDHLHIDPSVITETVAAFSSVPDTVVAIAPGNHDPFSIDSCYSARTWPSNVIVFRGGLTSLLFEEKNVCLWGAGFESTCQAESFFGAVREDPDEDRINLCVIHADLLSPGQTSLYNPVFRDMIRKSGFDYIAMGHVHKRTPVLREGRTFFAYSGPPEGHGFDEPGEQGVYLGDVSKGSHSLEFRRIARRCYYDLPVSVDGAMTQQEVADRIAQEIRERFPEDGRENLYKVLLKGAAPQTLAVDPQMLGEKIAPECFFAKIENRTVLELDYEILSREQTLKGIFIRKMLELIAAARGRKDEPAVLAAENALQYGLKAFEGEVRFDED